jgi:hypothetical protein
MACKVINLIGGPGSGKSTAMAGVFYNLKRLGVNCEMVTEYAKDKVWDESYYVMKDQLYISAKYYHKLWRVADKVDFIITDSSLLSGIFYDKDNSEAFKNLMIEKYNEFDNVLYFLNRDDSFYQSVGRIQDLKEAKEIDANVKAFLDSHNIPYKEINAGSACEIILKDILENNNIFNNVQ